MGQPDLHNEHYKTHCEQFQQKRFDLAVVPYNAALCKLGTKTIFGDSPSFHSSGLKSICPLPFHLHVEKGSGRNAFGIASAHSAKLLNYNKFAPFRLPRPSRS